MKRKSNFLASVVAPGVALSLLVAIQGAAGSRWSQEDSRGSTAEAEEAARDGKFDVAAAAYRRLLEVQPNSAQLWSNLAGVEAMGGHCDRALSAAHRAKSLDPKLFAPWYFAGVCDLQFHRDEDALAALNRATEINPRDLNAWYLRAQAAANLDRLAVAFQSVLQGLTLDPGQPEGYYRAGKIALDLAARCYDQVMAAPSNSQYPPELEGDRNTAQGLVANGIDNYRQALTLAPSDAGLHFALANAYLASKKFPEAETEVRQCLALLTSARMGSPSHAMVSGAAPRTEWVRLRMARALAGEGRAEEARRILESVQPERLESPEECEDFLASAYELRMTALARRGLAAAIARFPGETEFGAWKTRLAQAVGASPDDGKPPSAVGANPSTKVGLAVRFLAVSNPATGNVLPRMFSSAAEYGKFRAAFLHNDAIRSARMISPRLERLPQDPAEASAIGSLLQWLSYRFYERLATDYAGSDAAQRLAAENLSAAGEQEKALEIYQSMLDRAGPSPDLLRAIAQIHWTEHRWDEALEALVALNKLDPSDATTLVNMGRIYSYKQDFPNAERCFREAAEADPRMFEARLGMGEVLRRRGDDDGALREFKVASEINPENPQPHYALFQLYRKRERKELAQQELAAYQRLHAAAALEKTHGNRSLVPLE